MSDTGVLATERLRPPLGWAPGGLRFVQELVNTGLRAPAPEPGDRLADLLAGLDSATGWLDRALGLWATAAGQPVPELRFSAADLAPLREVREAIRDLAARTGPAAAPGWLDAGLMVGVDADGRVGYRPAETGWRGVAGLAAAEILLAQHGGQWTRFKACPFTACGVAFYDTSRNASRVWHDVRTCGNQTNLRAFRARQREAAWPPAPAGARGRNPAGSRSRDPAGAQGRDQAGARGRDQAGSRGPGGAKSG